MTIRRAILVLCIAVGGMGIGKAWQHVDLCRAIIGCSTLFLAIGILAEVYYGNFLRGGNDYRFSGVFHPNGQAFSCGMLILACTSMYQVSRRKYFLLLAAFAAYFLILTKGRTGTASLCVAALWLWWMYFRWRTTAILMLIGGLGLAIALLGMGASNDYSQIFDKVTRMGRDEELADPSKLTGRLPIWQEALSDFVKRPIFGYGYGAYWLPRRIEHFEKLTGWSFNHAHSIYIESLVNLGVIGFVIGALTVMTTIYRSLQLKNTVAADGGRFVVSILIFDIVSGFSESSLVGDGYPAMVAIACIGFIAFQGADLRTRLAMPGKGHR